MSDFINTVEIIGEDELMDQIIQRTITEFRDDRISAVQEAAFTRCLSLTSVDLPNVTEASRSAFNTCTALEAVRLPSLSVINGESASGTGLFAGCTNLKRAEFTALTSIGARAFYGCTALSALILRGSTLCTLSNTTAVASSGIGKGTGYIYVPRALVEEYKAATNWSTVAAQFRALEDYTVDGTTTGALDETKIAA